MVESDSQLAIKKINRKIHKGTFFHIGRVINMQVDSVESDMYVYVFSYPS